MGKLLVIRVKEKNMRGDKCYDYKNSVNLSDANMLALVFLDLINLFNAPINKAVSLLKKQERIFPIQP